MNRQRIISEEISNQSRSGESKQVDRKQRDGCGNRRPGSMSEMWHVPSELQCLYAKLTGGARVYEAIEL